MILLYLINMHCSVKADLCGEPLEIFNYMHSQSICSGLSQFYESWAFVLESIGNNKKADEVFSLGINRNAQPLERLQQLHRLVNNKILYYKCNKCHTTTQ